MRQSASRGWYWWSCLPLLVLRCAGTASGTWCSRPSSQPGGSPIKESSPRGGRPTGQGCLLRPRGLHRGHFITRCGSVRLTEPHWRLPTIRRSLAHRPPCVMLIHEIGRSRKDFEDAVLDLKGQGLGRAPSGAWLRRFQHGSAGTRSKPARPAAR